MTKLRTAVRERIPVTEEKLRNCNQILPEVTEHLRWSLPIEADRDWSFNGHLEPPSFR